MDSRGAQGAEKGERGEGVPLPSRGRGLGRGLDLLSRNFFIT